MAHAASTTVGKVTVSDFDAEREGSYLAVRMNIGLAGLKVKSSNSLTLTPWLVNGNDSIAMPWITVFGRSRYYQTLRSDAKQATEADGNMVFRSGDCPENVQYSRLIPFEEWMDGAGVKVKCEEKGCCQATSLAETEDIGKYSEAFFPELVYIRPQASREKRRTLEGRAYIDFPVDKTEIYPDYRRNTVELARIKATIDTVRDDADATIDGVWLKGFASPESPYSHNSDLAHGRTESLRRWIDRLYDFGDIEVSTEFEPEDWAGLRKAVESSNLEHRDAILRLIDTDMDPDAKEAKIKKEYPEEYRFMLETFYPALRHTDYRVSYVIRSYSDPEEIMEVMKTRPQKLDQNEFYVAAEAYEPGSEGFSEVFETAVRMYPDDEVANLNAANAAMRRGDNESAAKYLERAGDSPEALYARGSLAVREKDYEKARHYLRLAEEAGVAKAAETLKELDARGK